MTKRKKCFLAVVLGVLTLGAFTAYAGSGHGCGGWKHGGDPEKRAAFMEKRMTKKLDLNESQVAKLKTVQQIFIDFHKQRKENTRQELLSLLDAPELDQSKALSLLEDRGAQIRKTAPQMIAAIAEFTNSLSDEQREKMKKVIQKFSKHGGFSKMSHS